MNKQQVMMKAVRYVGSKQPFQLETNVPIPDDLQDDEVLIEVKAAALCHTELHFEDGTLDLGIKPLTMGHETVGIITKVGSSVSSQRIGQRVIVYYYVGCQTCRWCLGGNENICQKLKAEYGFISDGGLANYIKCPSRNAIVLPSTILSFEQAAPIGCSVTTAVHAAKLAHLSSTTKNNDSWCVVLGTNGVGLHLIQLLKHVYKTNVIAVGRSAAKLQKAKELGADHIIDGTDPTRIAPLVRKYTFQSPETAGGEGADVIFECVGHRTTLDACLGWTGALGRRGTLVLLGYCSPSNEHDVRVHPMPTIVYEQTIVGSVGAILEDLKEAVEYVANGTIQTVVHSTLPLEEFDKGLTMIRQNQCVGKIVCIP